MNTALVKKGSFSRGLFGVWNSDDGDVGDGDEEEEDDDRIQSNRGWKDNSAVSTKDFQSLVLPELYGAQIYM